MLQLLNGLQGTSALLVRSLIEDLRNPLTQFQRGLFVAAGLLGAFIAFSSRDFISAPGLSMLQTIWWADAALLFWVGIPYFTAAFSEERANNTLGLLKLSGIDPLGLLLGKSTSRFLGVAIGLVLQTPFLLLGITLGGVTFHQIAAATVSLLAHLFMVCNLSLYCSLVSRDPARSAGSARGNMILWYVLPSLLTIPILILTGLAGQFRVLEPVLFGSQIIVGGISSSQLFQRIGAIGRTTFDGSWVSLQLFVEGGIGLVYFLRSWRCFERVTQAYEAAGLPESTTVLISPILSTQKTRKATKVLSKSGISVERPSSHCSDRPFLWKEMHCYFGGWRGLYQQWIGYLLLLSAIYVVCSIGVLLISMASISQESFLVNWLGFTAWFGVFPMWGGAVLTIGTCLMAFHSSLQQEFQDHTWETLVLTPHRSISITLWILGGRLLGTLPALIWAVIGLAWVMLLPQILLPSTHFPDWEMQFLISLVISCITWLGAFLNFGTWLFFQGIWGNGCVRTAIGICVTCVLAFAEMLLCMLTFAVFSQDLQSGGFGWFSLGGWISLGIVLNFFYTFALWTALPGVLQRRLSE